MTDRIKGLIVVLDKDYRDDDVKAIVDVIRMVKGVVAVRKSVTDAEDWMNRTRVKHELLDKLVSILMPETEERSG